MEAAFTTKERKKEFEKVFKEKILPLFQQHGFSRHTKTSKRLFKAFEKGLTVFVFLEYKNRFGCYDITIAYFDEDYGTVYEDNYLAIASRNMPSFSGDNISELNTAVDKWLGQVEVSVLPFVEQRTTHKALAESTDFYISKARKEQILEFLNKKSKEE